MWNIVGQTKAVDLLRRSLEEGRLAHAYVFAGPRNVGKMTLAINLAQALNCPAEDKPCGQCRSCCRIAAGSHPDVQVVETVGPGTDHSSPPQKEIGIGQIKGLQHTASLKPYEGVHRVFIVDGAENMSEEAANSLLKILEEPPPSTTFALLALDESLLLPTISSRCQTIHLAALPVSQVREALVRGWGIEPGRAELLARMSHGCMGWAISAMADEAMVQERSDDLAELMAAADSDLSGRFGFAARLASQFGRDRASVQGRLELWLTWWRDLLLTEAGCPELAANADRLQTLREQASAYGLNAIRRAIKSLRDAMSQLDQNVNPRLTLEVLMLAIPFGQGNSDLAGGGISHD